MGLRDTILAANDLHREAVEVPEWGCTVYVRELTGAERDALEDETYRVKGKDVTVNRQNFRARLLSRALVDADGKPVFSGADVQALGGKASRVLDRLSDIASRLSGLGKKDEEQLLGNSHAGPSAGNGSVSPATSECPSPSASAA